MRALRSTAEIANKQAPSDDRAARAERLLREALALLACGSGTELLIDSKRESDRLLRLPEVQELTGLRRSTIYAQMQSGMFPHSVKAGPRAATWSEAAVQAWISDRIRSRTAPR